MKKCTNKDCGKQIEVKADFCDYCGSPQTPENSNNPNQLTKDIIAPKINIKK